MCLRIVLLRPEDHYAFQEPLMIKRQIIVIQHRMSHPIDGGLSLGQAAKSLDAHVSPSMSCSAIV